MDDAGNNVPERVVGRPFQKGKSGNPSGRPKLVKEFHEWLVSQAYPAAQEALMNCLRSDNGMVAMMAVKEVHDRLFGKVPQAIVGEDGGPVRLDLVSLSMRLKQIAGEVAPGAVDEDVSEPG